MTKYRMRFILFALALFCPSLAVAQSAKIVGPDTAPVGSLIILRSTGSSGDGFAWARLDDPDGLLPVDGGANAVAAIGTPGAYTFILFAVKAGTPPQIAVDRHTVTVTGPAPAPAPLPPIPVNPPAPTPINDADPLGLTSIITSQVASGLYPANLLSGVASLADLSSQTMATNPNDQATFNLLWQSLVATFPEIAGFFSPIQGKFDALNRQGVKITGDQAVKVFTTIASVIRSTTPAPSPTPAPVSTGHLYATLINSLDDPTTAPVRISAIKATLRGLDCSWFVAAPGTPVANQFAAHTATSGIPACIITTASGRVVATIKNPTSPDQIVSAVKNVRGATK